MFIREVIKHLSKVDPTCRRKPGPTRVLGRTVVLIYRLSGLPGQRNRSLEERIDEEGDNDDEGAETSPVSEPQAVNTRFTP